MLSCEEQMPADVPSTKKKPEGNSEGNSKGVRQSSSSTTSQNKCEGLGRDPAPDTDQTLRTGMLLSNLQSPSLAPDVSGRVCAHAPFSLAAKVPSCDTENAGY